MLSGLDRWIRYRPGHAAANYEDWPQDHEWALSEREQGAHLHDGEQQHPDESDQGDFRRALTEFRRRGKWTMFNVQKLRKLKQHTQRARRA